MTTEETLFVKRPSLRKTDRVTYLQLAGGDKTEAKGKLKKEETNLSGRIIRKN